MSNSDCRQASIHRKTSETDINLFIRLDGSGDAQVDTGIGFFDHMLKSFAKHGMFDLKLNVTGDLIVDCHHTIEDVGIVLGEAIKKALGDKKSIRRYGDIILPMDEALILCAIDLSGRPYLVFDSTFSSDMVGYFDTQMVKEFFYAISYSAGMNLHIRKITGENDHHIIEGIHAAAHAPAGVSVRLDLRLAVWHRCWFYYAAFALRAFFHAPHAYCFGHGL